VIRPSGGFRIAEGGPWKAQAPEQAAIPYVGEASQNGRPCLVKISRGRVFFDLPVGSYCIMEILLSLSITIDEPLELCVSMPINSLP
jgi:hypothetical protein